MLVYSTRREDLGFRDEWLRMEADDANFALVATTTRGARHRPQDCDRRLDRSLLRDVLHRWGHAARQVCVCGSDAFVEAVTGSLVLEAVAAKRIRSERFGGKP